MIDARVPCESFIVQSLVSTASDANVPVAKNDSCKVLSVRWPVLEGVDGTGLLVLPNGDVRIGICETLRNPFEMESVSTNDPGGLRKRTRPLLEQTRHENPGRLR